LLLIFVTCIAEGKCSADNADVLMNHELLLPGHLLTMIVKEKLDDILVGMKALLIKDFRGNSVKCLEDLHSSKYFQKLAEKSGCNIGRKLETFLSTGNLVTSTGLDLQQVSGYTIVAERLNIFRYLSHFQSVHRGQFFTTMKTTTVRKLFPESWGFLCPVHTPDGSPCGLLNHLAKDAVILSFPTEEQLPTTPEGILIAPGGSSNRWIGFKELKDLLVSLGVMPSGKGGSDGQIILDHKVDGYQIIPVLIDGAVIGGISVAKAPLIVAQLRHLKVTGGMNPSTRIDPTLEIAYLPPSPTGAGGVYPGLYIFGQPGRLIRPVIHLSTQAVEWIGPMEQAFMEIACLNDDLRPGETTHVEISPHTMLSHVAFLTPYSDCNQSPRNMYQCQV
jgi:DNA-directed RNA polymerase I subunit RPA2